MDYEKMLEQLQEFRPEIASEARFLYAELLQRLTNNGGYVNTETRYQIVDYVHYKFTEVERKLEAICNGGVVSPIGRLPYSDKTNALLIMINFLCDPKVRENKFLSNCLELFCMDMFADIADDTPVEESGIVTKHCLPIFSRVLQRRGYKNMTEVKRYE